MHDLEDRMFMIGMWWRIGYGTLRIIFGLVLLKVVGMPLMDVLTKLMGHELVEDPNDMLYAFVSHLLQNYPLYVSYFLAVYFIFWGIIDVVLSYNLIKYKLWAFPISFVLIGTFVVYEIARFSQTHSLILLGVLFIDTAILWLIGREYKKHKMRSAHQNN